MPVKESCLHPVGADFRLDVENPCILKASPSKLNINPKDQRLKPNVENSDCPVFGTIAIQHGFSTRLREFHHLRSLHDVCRGPWTQRFGTLQRPRDKRAADGVGQLHQVAKKMAKCPPLAQVKKGLELTNLETLF